MAMKRVNTEFVKMEDGDTVTGYLKSIGEQHYAATATRKEGSAPTLILIRKAKDKNGDAGTEFKINLGQTAYDIIPKLVVGALTEVKRPAKKKRSNAGNEFVDWEISQDTEDRAAA